MFEGDEEEALSEDGESVYIGREVIYDWTLMYLQLAEESLARLQTYGPAPPSMNHKVLRGIAAAPPQEHSMTSPVISRLAPTPSGYLHLGNALNFLITWHFVRRRQGTLILRIDDADSTRTRPQYIEDIFRTLEWLGLDWDLGPSGPDDFQARYSQRAQKEKYWQAIGELARAYNCDCSRKTIRAKFGSTAYGGSCRNRELPFVPGTTARRIVVDRPLPENGRPVDLGQTVGDFVLWTRDDTPAYQLVSLVEDESHQVLAKSQGSTSLTALRQAGVDKSTVIEMLHPYLARFFRLFGEDWPMA